MRRLTWMSRGRANARPVVILFIVAALFRRATRDQCQCGHSWSEDSRHCYSVVRHRHRRQEPEVMSIELRLVTADHSGPSLHLMGLCDCRHPARFCLRRVGSNPGQTWHVRFTPTVTGLWTYSISPRLPDPGLATVGHLLATSPLPSSHGFLRIDSTHLVVRF